MKRQAGLWIDHHKAVIVTITGEGEEVKEISSNMEHDVRRKGGPTSENGSAEDVRVHRFENHLNRYYDEVVAALRGVDTIQIFGPGEAKGELRKRLERKSLKAHVLEVETVDKMTDRQIAAKVRDRF